MPLILEIWWYFLTLFCRSPRQDLAEFLMAHSHNLGQCWSSKSYSETDLNIYFQGLILRLSIIETYLKISLRRRRPKTSNKLSQTRGRATACSSGGTLTQICYSPAGVTMGMSSNAVNTPVGVMGTSWQLAISSWNMLTCSLALLYWCLRETRAVACVWCGFGRPLPPLIRHLARWPIFENITFRVTFPRGQRL